MTKFVYKKEGKPKEPTKEQLARYKDFSALSSNYDKITKRSKKPLYRDPKLFILLFLLALIAFLVFLETSNK